MYTGEPIELDDRHDCFQLAAGFCVWYALHGIFRTLGVPRGARAQLSAVSCVHAVVISYHAFDLPLRLPWDYVLALFTSYMAYDTVHRYNRMDASMRIHHACAIVASLAIRGDRAIEHALPALAAPEISSIFLNMMSVLEHLDKGHTRVALLVKALFAVTFVVVRIIWLPPMLWHELSTGGALADVSLWVRASLAALVGANFWWLRELVAGVRRAARQVPAVAIG